MSFTNGTPDANHAHKNTVDPGASIAVTDRPAPETHVGRNSGTVCVLNRSFIPKA